MAMHTRTIICEKSGITFTLTDDFPGGSFDTIKQHIHLDRLHGLIEKYQSRCGKSYLAGGILTTLLDCNRFAYLEHYPKHLMGQLNAELCAHDSEFLYDLYQRVQTFCYSRSVAGHAQFNLMVVNGKWDIARAIACLVNDVDEDIPTNGYIYATQIAAAEVRKSKRNTLTKDNAGIKPEKLGNMNIDAVLKRVKMLSNKCHKVASRHVAELEAKAEITLDQANTVLFSYPLASEDIRFRMAKLYRLLASEFRDIVYTPTMQRSFTKVGELLVDQKTRPLEVTGGAASSLDDLDLDSLDL